MICHNCKHDIGNAAVCPYCGTIFLKEPQPHHLPSGSMVAGRYWIEGVLGEGGFGITYRGYDYRLALAIAVKEYFPHGFSYRNTMVSNEVFVSSSDEKDYYEHGRERFLSEARTLAKFQSEPGVVSVIDFVEENNTAYLIMEYIEGVTLMQYLKQHGVMSTGETFAMFEPMMRTLEKIHNAGVIHRDISPDNIMRLSNGHLKLMDFGSAKEYINDNRSMSVVLKQGYAPMEQYHRNGEQGPWTDVYALCATMYHCITGTRPDDALDRMMNETLRRPSSMGIRISTAYENILMYGLAIRKEDRCKSMTEMIRLLERAKRGEPVIIPKSPNITMVAEAGKPNPYRNQNPPVAANRNYVQSAAPIPQTPAKTAPKKSKNVLILSIVAVVLVAAIIAGIVGVAKIKNNNNNNSDSESGSSVVETEKETEEETQAKATEKPRATVAPTTAPVNSNSEWTDIVAIAAADHNSFGVKKDGTVVAIGENEKGECDVSGWTDITALSTGFERTVGVKKDGTAVAVGEDVLDRNKVDGWTDITEVSVGLFQTLGLKKDGTVVVTGSDYCGETAVTDWTDIVAVGAGKYHSIGLKKDGTVVSTAITDNGSNDDRDCGQTDVSDWTNITAISVWRSHTVGLKKDGTVVAVGENDSGQCNVGEWTDITAVSTGLFHTVGLKKDGTVVAVGSNGSGQCDVEGWTDIVAVAAGSLHTIGLKKDGTVVATGNNDDGQCDVY